jgi:hypothetical protein
VYVCVHVRLTKVSLSVPVCVCVCLGEHACVLEPACVILRVCVVCVRARVILLRYLLFGLYLNKAGYGLHDDDEAQWFIPHLQTMSDPAKAIGGMLKALRPLSDGGQKQYQAHPVHSLPDEPSAAGFRQGFATYVSLSLSLVLSPSL